MKNLVQYILEASEKMHPTKEWMIEHYNKFNKELFNGELPGTNIVSLEAQRFKSKAHGNALGMQGFGKTFFISKDNMENGMYRMLTIIPGKQISYRSRLRGWEPILTSENCVPVNSCKELQPWIWMNTIYVATEEQLEDTLIHEMVHLWVSKDGLEPKQAHGKEFKRKCNEVRKLAKEKYGIDYELQTKANRNDEYEYDDQKKQETFALIQKNKKRGGGIIGIYIIFDESIKTDIGEAPYDKRFLFCTKRMFPKLLNEIKHTGKEYLKHIYISEDSYEKMSNVYGKFQTMNTYRFWDGNDYEKSKEFMIDNAKDILNESLTEAKKPYIKPEIFVYEIPANSNLSNINLEDIINTEIEDDEKKGSLENNKKIIDSKK